MLSKIIWLFLTTIIIAVITIVIMSIEDKPLVRSSTSVDAVGLDRVKSLIKRNDPRRLPPGEIVTQWIDEEEISLIADYALSQISGGGIAVELHPGRAYVQLSILIPDNPLGRYLNFSIILQQWSDTLMIESLSLGRLAVPGWIAEPLKQNAHKALLQFPEYAAALNALNGMQILEDRFLVLYQWQPELIDQLKDTAKSVAIDDELRSRLLAYTKQINAVAGNPRIPNTASLTEFIKPVFILAKARGGDAAEENRAALLALSFYFSGVDIARMLGVDLPAKKTTGKRLTLSNRYDFAQHFLSSAALVVTAGNSGIADTVGLFKELDDAKGGSGFSFTDLGADRSGVRAAEFAIRDPLSARKFQNVMAGALSEPDFIPDFLDLPELLPNDEFKRRYGGIHDPRYNRIAEDIESRIDKCSLYN